MEKSFVNPTPDQTSPIIIYKQSAAGNVIAVSLGTCLLLIARNIPEPSLARFWLTMVSPAVSVFSTWLWKLLTKQYFRIDQWMQQRQLDKKITLEMERVLANPAIADAEKERLKREQAKLALQKVDILIGKMRAIQKKDL
ncbi:hypothetical protein ACFOTA_06440 [Chitinophaga sp. GCM10012297]|uniref:Uncharacterized protein n=1 Tax=Chitinophaga chungangae TaxID=2821488 RepID=A0ABS3YBX9_9BACT|nr:hypothetical protein [Chitinophaga chungangae]MBO9151838.1 hypothetical protein [Chitinophaga chungangae]